MLRIVSLIASATEIVHALGLGASQVGRSHECDYPDSVRLLPVCTRPRFPIDGDSAAIDRNVKQTLSETGILYEVFSDTLESLAPTHILTQTQCEVCAVSLQDVERAFSNRFSTRPQVVATEPNSLTDIWADIRRIGEACGVPARAEDVIEQLKDRMQRASDRAAQSARVRVACIEWLEPLMAAGNWVPELVEMANGTNLFGEPGKHSPWMTWEKLTAADPEVIIAMPCGFDLERTIVEMHWLTSRPGWDQLSARVYAADGNAYFNRPGPRVVESLEMLSDMLHSDRTEGHGWRRLV